MAFTASFGLPPTRRPSDQQARAAANSPIKFIRVLSVNVQTSAGVSVIPIAASETDEDLDGYLQAWLQQSSNRQMFGGQRKIDLIPFVGE